MLHVYLKRGGYWRRQDSKYPPGHPSERLSLAGAHPILAMVKAGNVTS